MFLVDFVKVVFNDLLDFGLLEFDTIYVVVGDFYNFG